MHMYMHPFYERLSASERYNVSLWSNLGMSLWGRVMCTKSNYYIFVSQGSTSTNVVSGFFWTTSNAWQTLNKSHSLTPEDARSASRLIDKYTYSGDPSMQVIVPADGDSPGTYITEGTIMTYMTFLIGKSCYIVPKCALMKTDDSVTIMNPTYRVVGEEVPIERTEFCEPVIDSSSTLGKDSILQKNCYDGKTVFIQSLTWPGAFSWHVLGSTLFGTVYFGDGIRRLHYALI